MLKLITRSIPFGVILLVILSCIKSTPIEPQPQEKEKSWKLERLIWEFKISRAISSTPAWSKSNIFFGDLEGNFYILDTDGHLVWTTLPYAAVSGHPILLENRFLVLDKVGNVVMYKNNGEQEWIYTSKKTAQYAPCMTELFGIFFVTRDSCLINIDTSPQKKWQQKMNEKPIGCPSTNGNCNKIFVPFEKGICAFNAETGQTEWQISCGELKSGLAVSNSSVFSAEHYGLVSAFAINDGEVLWKSFLTGPFWINPLIKRNIVFIASLQGTVTALNAFDGSIIWTYKGLGSITTPISAGEDAICIIDSRAVITLLSVNEAYEICKIPTLNRTKIGCLVGKGEILIGTIEGQLMLLRAPEITGNWNQFGNGIEHSFYCE